MMHRFLCEEEFEPNRSVELSREETHHLAKVLRISPSEEVELINGRGGLARARVVEIKRESCRLEILSVRVDEKNSRIQICFSIPKAPALDFLVRRITEIGVAGFQPIETSHSLHPDRWNADRWNRVVAEVSKQCQQLHFPYLGSLEKFADWFERRDPKRVLVFCDESSRLAREAISKDAIGYDLVLGPEGGWSREEVERVRSSDAVFMGLGPNRLRTETAALVATVLLKQAIGEIV